MVEKSDFIFVGTAVQTQSAWNPEHTRIYTRTTFEVEEYIKGGAGGAVVVETLGGVVGDVGMMVPGVPQFRRGEKNLLFISTGPRTGKHRVVGWSQGRFKIKKGPRRGETVSFSTQPGRKGPRKKTAYQVFVGKKVSAALKNVPKSKRAAKAPAALTAAAKAWATKKRRRRVRR